MPFCPPAWQRAFREGQLSFAEVSHMKIEMFGATGEAIAASIMAAAVLFGAAIGSAPATALASSASDTDVAATAGGARYFAMTGDAMEPSIPRGALTVAQISEPGDVRVGDIVTVQLTGGLVTRRVVGSDTIDAGRLLTLQADASAAAEDVGVLFTDKATVVRAYVPFAGYVAELAGRWGRAALGLAGLALLGLAIVARFRMRRPLLLAPETLTSPVASAT
jgi:hypothetical protein